MNYKTIDYVITFDYERPDSYNKYSKNYECEIDIRIDHFWKYFPDFDTFLNQIIYYQLVECICLEAGLQKIKSQYPCHKKNCPMEFPALIMLNKVEHIHETKPIGYKIFKIF